MYRNLEITVILAIVSELFFFLCVPSFCSLKMKKSKPLAKEVPKAEPAEDGPEPSLSGFGMMPSIGASDIYLKLPKKKMVRSGGGTGSVTTKKELGIKLTDFFDYSTVDATAGSIPQPVNNYYWETDQNLFEPSSFAQGGRNKMFCRVRSLSVWVMPVGRGFASEQIEFNSQSMFTVNCQTPGIAAQFSSTTEAFGCNTQVTNILPTINPKWKKVFSCDLQKTFQSGTVRPVFSASEPTQQCLFQMSVVDPTTGRVPVWLDPSQGGEEIPIRVKVQLMLDQPIGTLQRAFLTVFKNEEFNLPFTEQNGAAYSGTTERYVQLDMHSVRDNFR